MNTLFNLLFVTILVACSALFSALMFGILSLNRYDLKRRALKGDKDAKIVYPLRTMGYQLPVTLAIGVVLVNAAIAVLLDAKINSVLAILLATIIIVVFGLILPIMYIKTKGLSLTARLAPLIKYVMIVLAPAARPVGRMLDDRFGENAPQVHSKEELFKIIDDHKVSEHSDIEKEEIRIVKHALTFGDKQVREIMIPRRSVVAVSADEVIGPIVIDELHKSGHSRFPVYSDKKAESFIGTLYLRDLIGLNNTSSAKQLMRSNVFYVHEEKTLDHALKVFLKTNHHLLIVVNSFEEFVGVLSLEDVIEQILGRQIVDEFDEHADIRAVAKSLATEEAKLREKNVE